MRWRRRPRDEVAATPHGWDPLWRAPRHQSFDPGLKSGLVGCWGSAIPPLHFSLLCYSPWDQEKKVRRIIWHTIYSFPRMSVCQAGHANLQVCILGSTFQDLADKRDSGHEGQGGIGVGRVVNGCQSASRYMTDLTLPPFVSFPLDSRQSWCPLCSWPWSTSHQCPGWSWPGVRKLFSDWSSMRSINKDIVLFLRKCW